MLREVIVKIRLERIDIQERVIVEALLDSRVTGLVMSLEFAKKQGFKLKKIKRLINIYLYSILNRFLLIKGTIYISYIYYQGYKKRMKIDMIRGQK